MYGSSRLGINSSLTDKIKAKQGHNLSGFQKTYVAMFAGATGALIGSPCDLVLVRMQADKRPGIEES